MKAGWEVRTLGESCSIARGGSPRPIQEFLTNDADGVNWIKISDATASDRFIFETKEKIKPSGISRSRLVKEGDFILSNSMSFGRPYIMRTSGCIHDGWLVLSEYERHFDQAFLYHLLSSPVVFDQFNKLAAGSTVRNLNIESASRVVLPIPPIQEQQRIVAILDQTFEGIAKARANAEQNLQNARALFESYLQNVFTQCGEGYEEKRFDEVLEIKNGKDQKPVEKAGGKYPIYGSAGNVMGWTDSYICDEQTTIIGRKGTINRPIFIETKFWNVDTAFGLSAKPNLNPKFLYFFCLSYDFSLHNRGTTIPSLVKTDLLNIKISVPSLTDQECLVEKFSDLHKETQRLEALYQRKIACLDELKKSLLQQAFAGEL